MSSGSEYIDGEMEQHPELEYLSDSRMLKRFVREGNFGYRASDSVVFQTLRKKIPGSLRRFRQGAEMGGPGAVRPFP